MRHSSLPLALSTLVGLLSLAAVVPAQSPYTEGVKKVGKIRPETPINLGRVPAPDRPAVQRTLERLRDVMLASPPFSPPVGFELQPTLQGYEHTNELWKSGPYGYHVQGLIYWYLQTRTAKNVHPSTVAYVSIRLIANDLTTIWGRNERWRRIDGVDAYWEPQITGSLGGYPLYGTGKVILTKIARPLVVPVSRERVLRIELDEHRKNLSQFPKDSKNRGRAIEETCIAQLESELSRLMPEQLAAPAYLSMAQRPGQRGPICSFVVEKGFPHARRIVTANPDFYDPTVSRTALQMLVVDHSAYMEHMNRTHVPMFDRMRTGLDYDGLFSLLEGH